MPSRLPVTARLPSREMLAEVMAAVCPRSCRIGLPAAAFQTTARLSSPAVNTRAPSGENTAESRPAE